MFSLFFVVKREQNSIRNLTFWYLFEVESWFECPLEKLMDASQWNRDSVFWKGATREYLEMNHDGYRIWGVTAAICWNLSRRIAWLEAH